MKTISQVAELTGISTRTLQYYDEIGLLKPSELTPSGYRLYSDEVLQKLQQILFFKELDFKLKEINEILQKPEFDKIEAFRKQKKLLCLKRDRINKLIELLERLEKGEPCMSFKEFDLSEYIEALEQFKNQKADDVIKHWGSIENFDQLIQKIKDDESNVAKLAIKQFGSIEKYTEAMKYNLEHFSDLMEQSKELAKNKDEILQKSNDLYVNLTSDLTKDAASREIQDTVHEIVELSSENNLGIDMGDGIWDMVIESYSHDTVREITDKKYGAGASDYIMKALQYYFHN
ncbi:MAG TPA: MerR family transcriptional regulator [Lachnoclostridium sp.]|uniref:DNA-binding transcriptional MerR regulator n=1 Tax=[Clostridium] celerecrescens 18A TaxID=1286362 RepID=A0A2M8Z0Q7_9FIRM|nr:MerR family transcriptional regulator [Lacrimispora celerecrescens]PJJ27038.1 DNA-binding transcriptional MerR regulator [[Clostridium] celerecrescens 18A]HBE84218.1 MerR family transcriptional regulator [Lachnoclostridium sp.]